MPSFNSKSGEWWPADELTKKELKEKGLDHIGIHVSEDPYIKNMEYVLGIPRRELVEGQKKMMMQTMQEQVMKTNQALVLALSGDKDAAKEMISSMKEEAPAKPEPAELNVDFNQLRKDEFTETMEPKGKTVTAKPRGRLPKEVKKTEVVHEQVGTGGPGGFGKPNS